MAITRCVCKNISFARLLQIHEQTGQDADAICKQTGCGEACGMCTPYVHAAITLKRAALPVCSPGQLMLMIKRHQAKQATSGTKA